MEKFFDWVLTFIGYFMSVILIGLFCAIIVGVLLVMILGLWQIIQLLI